MIRFFFFLIGFGLAVSGGITTIAYLNLLTIGYSFIEYLQFMIKRVECLLLPFGIMIIWGSIYLPLSKDKYLNIWKN